MVSPYVNSPAEDREEAKRKRKGRRNVIIVIAIMNALILADGFYGAADIRHISTPQGAAAAWADAAAGDDCDTYVGLEGPVRLASELAGITLGRTVRTARDGLCQKVAAAWAGVSVQTSEVVTRAGSAAVVRLTVSGRDVGSVTGELFMSRQRGRWKVGYVAAPCPVPAYSPKLALCPVVTLPHT